jgi:hypothetical protein
LSPDELRPGLWRWTASHPEWRAGAEPGSPDDWPQLVGCIAYESPKSLVLIDPLLPEGEERSQMLDTLDSLAERAGGSVAILTTISFHRRSRDELAQRYDASTARAKDSPPRGVETLLLRGFGETMVWLPEHRALVPGDRLLVDPDSGLRLCPESWLGYLGTGVTLADLREAMRPLLELPIEMVLVSHGEPVLIEGRAELRRALATGEG